MRSPLAPLVALALLTLAACKAKVEARADTPAAAAAVDTRADEQAIRDLDKRWVDMVAARDSSGIAELFAEDGVEMMPNAPAFEGREGARRAFGGMFGMKGLKLTFEPKRIEIAQAGDMAVDRGTWELEADGPKDKIRDNGKYLVVWKKVGGQWKIAYDIFNSDKPAAP
jgi:uncharacterized protein (TIGR02246 family)